MAKLYCLFRTSLQIKPGKSGAEEKISFATEAQKNTNSIQCFCALVANNKLRSNFCKTLSTQWKKPSIFTPAFILPLRHQ